MTNTDLTLYEQFAEEIIRQVQQGAFRPGERLPSVREASRQRGLSISTVLQAYHVLEDRGVIEARPQSGYYVRPPLLAGANFPDPEPPTLSIDPATVRIDELTMQVLRQVFRPDLVPFGAAVPAPELLPTRRFNNILTRILRSSPYPENVCAIPEGTPELRAQVARRLSRMGCATTADDVIITNGCTEALSLALHAVCKPGDLVAVESPTYFVLLQMLEAQGLRALEIPTHARDGMSLDALEFALEHHPVRAVVVMTNFSNPLGSLMPEENKRALVDLLARYEVPLIEDDIYGELPHNNHRPDVAKAYDRQGLVLLCSSFTKDLAAIQRVGWIVPGRYRQRVQQLKVVSNLGTAILPQLAIAEFLENGGYDRHLRTVRREYAQRTAQMAQSILAHFPAGTRVTTPQGGFVLWVQLPEHVDSLQLYHRALQSGITIAPGYIFSATARFRNFIRLNAAYMNFAVEKSLLRLAALAKE